VLRWASIGALLMVLLVALFAGAPARVLPSLLPAGQVQLAGVNGTLWHGSASRALARTPMGTMQLGQVSWRLRPLSLLALSPTVEFDSQWGEQRVNGVLTVKNRNTLGLRDVEAHIDASLLRQLAPVAVDGQFSLLATRLDLRDGLPAGAEGRVLWERGAWKSPRGRVPLGSYAVDFSQADASVPLTGEVLTLDGPIPATGSVRLEGRDYQLDVRIGGDGPLDPGLAQALSLLARPVGEAFELHLEGTF
jgi:general secretion pathway protein N